ncbi:MAG: methylglyoxal synthase [Lachnospiraceae bacterium]|nr:methylglyoxal synthase [Lachnospiraceae bacterium]
MNIGLIAHDTKKTLIQNFCIAYRATFAKHNLYATGTTGRAIEDACGLQIHKLIAGHLGGENQLFTLLESNEIDAVIFLRDPFKTEQADRDVHSIMELCDERSIPIATNLASAEILIKAIERGDLEWREYK